MEKLLLRLLELSSNHVVGEQIREITNDAVSKILVPFCNEIDQFEIRWIKK